MANSEHLAKLKEGVEAWNIWRAAYLTTVDPSLAAAGLTVSFRGPLPKERNLRVPDLREADLRDADLQDADLRGVDFREADLSWADLRGTNLSGSDLRKAIFHSATLDSANLTGADLREADLSRADLSHAVLNGANLREASLVGARLVQTYLEASDLTGCNVYAISAWDLHLNEETKQTDLVITQSNEPAVVVDNLQVAQFVYLLLSNPEIGQVIDTIGEKGVLILGRFGDRKIVLVKIRERLRELGWVPFVFDFEKPKSKDFTATVRTLAGMSAFIIADITSPKSVPQEAQAVIPDYMVPFIPLIKKGEEPWAMFQDLWIRHKDWVFEPLEYSSIDELIPKMNKAIVLPALKRRKHLLAEKAKEMGRRSLENIESDDN